MRVEDLALVGWTSYAELSAVPAGTEMVGRGEWEGGGEGDNT